MRSALLLALARASTATVSLGRYPGYAGPLAVGSEGLQLSEYADRCAGGPTPLRTERSVTLLSVGHPYSSTARDRA